jgi:hypothetical protein
MEIDANFKLSYSPESKNNPHIKINPEELRTYTVMLTFFLNILTKVTKVMVTVNNTI